MDAYKQILTSKGCDYDLNYFLLLHPSEQGIILEELDLEKISAMLKDLSLEKRVSLFEVLPYHIVEKVTPLMTEEEKKAVGLSEEGDAGAKNKKKCIIS